MAALSMDSVAFWVAVAVVLFWFIGAYNRIVRLRSAALQSYGALDAALVRQIDFVRLHAAEGSGASGGVAASRPGPGGSLQAAADQLATLLAATRQRPLDPPRIAALGTALHVLLAAWQRLHPDAVVSFGADGTLSRPASLGPAEPALPASAPLAWPEPSAAAEIARAQFNGAVAQYNTAVREFPAWFVAWIMQLRPAAPLL